MERYDIAKELKSDTGKRYNSTTLPPTVQKEATDIYIITVIGDRLDLIAYDYYGDATKWWTIAAANPNAFKYNGSLAVEPGLQLRVPISAATTETQYATQNANR